MRFNSLLAVVRQLPAAAKLAAVGTALTVTVGVAAAAVGGAPAGGAGSVPVRATATHARATAGGAPGSLNAWDAATSTGVAAASTQAQTQAQAAASTTVTLVTGDTVRLDTFDGQQHAVLAPAPGARISSQDFTQFSLGGDLYVVPDEAVPFLGSLLDPRLFDVSYLARARLGVVRGRAAYGPPIPVTLSYSGSAAPRLAGLRVTTAAAGTAAGTFTPAQGAGLARLLAARWRTGSAAVSGISRLSLAPPAGEPPLPASPFQPGQTAVPAAAGTPATAGRGRGGLAFHQLTLNLVGPDGKPGATSLGIVQNLDDAGLDTIAVLLDGDPISFSLPAGTYSVAFSVLTPHSGTALGYDAALVTRPQLSLNSDETVTMDARTAVPYAATLTGATAPAVRFDLLDLTRGSVTGGIVDSKAATYLALASVSGDGIAATSMSAAPTAPVTMGSLSFTGLAQMSSGLGVSTGDPTYTFAFPNDGRIPPSLSYQVPAAGLTAVHSQLYSFAASASCGSPDAEIRYFVAQPWIAGNELDAAYAVPSGSRTDFIYDSTPRLDAWNPVADVSAPGYCHVLGATAPLAVGPGQDDNVAWGKEPLVPSPEAPLIADVPGDSGPGTVCPACRQGDVADVTIAADGDSSRHYDSPWFLLGEASPTSALRFYRDGSLAVTSDAICSTVVFGNGQPSCGMAPTGLVLPLLRTAATYRLDWQFAGTGPASVNTSWTFRSGPADSVLARLPGAEQCAPDPTAGCSPLPLLFPGYDLPLNIDSQATAGAPLTLTFSVGYQQGMAPAPGVSASTSASFDDGKTWSAPLAARALGGGRFSVTISQPQLADTTGFASLRVTATDDAGDSVTQTIIRAYGLTS
jgi:hypothetical protein